MVNIDVEDNIVGPPDVLTAPIFDDGDIDEFDDDDEEDEAGRVGDAAEEKIEDYLVIQSENEDFFMPGQLP